MPTSTVENYLKAILVRSADADAAVATGTIAEALGVTPGTFLVQVLKMDWKEVHEEAEALEHAISDRVLVRIDAILDHPDSDPHGDPIPSPKSPEYDRGRGLTLATCEAQKPLRVARILDQSAAFLEFIQRTGLKPGARVKVRDRDRASGVVRCELRGGEATLGLPEAANIGVTSA